MTFVLPSTYKTVADNLGIAYAAIRDAINDGTGATVYDLMQTSHQLIVQDTDNSVYSTAATPDDPAGSIAKDLGSIWFQTGNNDFTATQAKRIASSQFAAALRKLNTHVVNRTSVTTLASFYSTYAYSADRTASFNLFTQGDSSSYFSASFVELSSQLNVTIDTEYVQP